MVKNFKASDQTSISRRPDKRAVQVLDDDPIIIPHDAEPSVETPLPAENNPLPVFVLVVGSIVVLLCLFAPEWLDATWRNLLRQIFHFAGQ